MRSVFSPMLLALAILWMAVPAPAFADDSPAWFVPGAGVAWIPNELLSETTRPHVGGILGFRLSPSWALEGRGSYLKTPSTIGRPDLYMPHAEGGLTWFMNEGKSFSPYVTAGAGVAYFRFQGAGGGQKEFDYGGGVGVRGRFSEQVAFRTDVRGLRYRAPAPLTDGDQYYNHIEIFAGLSFDLGGAAKDLDRDGIADKVDKCAGTPFGARVDETGCPIDSDGDGVYDGIDACEGTPKSATADARGCPTDTDADGVLDGLDRCPNTPAGATVDASGCSADSDQDGVEDGLDRCPATSKGCVVNSNGCPTDTDADGVCDGLDKCSDTPNGARVDVDGCPIVVSEKETQLLDTGMIRIQNINFETGKSRILPEAERILDEIGNILARWPELRIEIGGHTDSHGSAARNIALSTARAQAVLDYLLVKFPELEPTQFTAEGYGASRSIGDNSTELGRALNRRVEFKVLNKEALKREKKKSSLAPRE